MTDGMDLAVSLAGLANVLTDAHGLDRTLVHVAQLAVDAIPGAEGSGLALMQGERRETVVATAPFVQDVDRIQYSLEQGPCIEAVSERRTTSSGNLGGDARWPRFGPRAGRLGVHSALSLPLLLRDRTVGALNVYARSRDAFDDLARSLGEAFAGPAAVTVSNVQALSAAESLVTQLQAALTSRADIDQAIGVLMSRTGGSAAEAFEMLRQTSQSSHTKVVEVARRVVQEATARARARRAQERD